MIRVRNAMLSATALATAWATPGMAQQAPVAGAVATAPPVDPQALPDDRPTDIVVTARKVSEKLSDAPVSVSVVSADTIAQRGLSSIDDFAKNATGISFSQAFGRSGDRPVIRGQSNVLAGVQFGVETGAAYFIDGIYYQGDVQSFDPLSLERVEIIKGPQSALYGRNTYAGAINYITKDPGKTFSVGGRARYAKHGETELALSAAGPILGDALGFRLGARIYRYDGEYTNLLTGKKLGAEKSDSIYATIVAKPVDDLKIRLRASVQNDRDGPPAYFLHGADLNNCKPGTRSLLNRQPSSVQPLVADISAGQNNNPNQYFCGALQPHPERLLANTDPVQTVGFGVRDGTAFDGIDNRQTNLSAIVDYDIGGSGFVLSSLTGWRKNKNRFGTDSDFSNAFFFLFPDPSNALATTEPAFANTTAKRQRDFSQEVRLSSPQDRPIRGLVGYYYYKQKLNGLDLSFANPVYGNPLGTPGSSVSTITDNAVFGLLAADITSQLTVTGEVRYGVEDKTLIDRSSAATAFCAGASGSAVTTFGFTGTCLGRGRWKGVDPRVTIDYKPSADTLFYAVYAQGRKPGGFNGTGGLTALALTGEDLTRYNQEKARGGEIGTKFALFNRRVNIGIAAFYNKLSAVQLTRSIPPSVPGQTTTSVAVNSGDARTQGIELEIYARPMRGVNARLGYSLADAKFTKGCDFDYFVLNSGGLQPNFSTTNPSAAGLPLCTIKGKQLPLGSKHMLNGSLDWETPLSHAVALVTNANFSWESKKYIQTDNLAFVPAAFLLNARIGIKTDRFTISAFGRNLTNEDALPLATRWFDYRYGNAARGLPAATLPGGPRFGSFDGRPAVIDTGAPRAFFAPLRRSRTFGIDLTFNYK